jgi:hypothetical protein
MLGKLFRYEFKALMRIMPIIYAAIPALALIMTVTTRVNAEKWQGFEQYLLSTVWSLALSALFIVHLVIILTRFRDNLLKDAGYLMFTLPVNAWHLIVSKALAALCAFLLSCVSCALAFALLRITNPESDFFVWTFSNPRHTVSFESLLFVVGVLVYAAQQLFLMYAAITVGQIAPRFRGLAGFGAYLVVMCALEIPITKGIAALIPDGLPTGLAVIITGAAFAALYLWCGTWLLRRTLNME